MLTGSVEPAKYYGVYQGFRFSTDPPKPFALTWNITPKNARTLPMLRTMSGSDLNLDIEYGMMRALLAAIGSDGLMRYPFEGDGPPQGTSYPRTNASMAFAIVNWYELTGDRAWLGWINLLCRGLRQATVRVDDWAYRQCFGRDCDCRRRACRLAQTVVSLDKRHFFSRSASSSSPLSVRLRRSPRR